MKQVLTKKNFQILIVGSFLAFTSQMGASQEVISEEAESGGSIRDRLQNTLKGDSAVPAGEYILFPEMELDSLSKKQKKQKITTKKGYISAVFFVSSWCVECQTLIPKIKKIVKHYEAMGLLTKIVYTYDTAKDGFGSAKEFGVLNISGLANSKVLSDFHSPEIPAVYFSDRNKLLAGRYLKMNEENLAELEDTFRQWLGF